MHLCSLSVSAFVCTGITDILYIPFPEIVATDDVAVAFKDIDVAILVGAMPRREGMERKDLLRANARIFDSQGKALDQYAKKNVKVSRSCLWKQLRSQQYESHTHSAIH